VADQFAIGAADRASRRVSGVALAVGGITLVGFALRMANFSQGLFGDELSTAWVLSGRSLGQVLHVVHSDDEITPPFFFVLAWLTAKLGSNPDLIRLPSLIAGTVSIPMVFLVGRRTVGEMAGVVGAAVFALSPFLIYYSTEARSYALMIALVLGAILAMLRALESNGRLAWAAYALCAALAMLSHYTSAFPLAALGIWALVAFPERRRPVILWTLAAAILFSPWIGGFIADSQSPTTKILSALSPFTVHWVRLSFENWALGYPYVQLRALPGLVAAGAIVVGIAIGVGALAGRELVARRVGGWRARLGAIPRGWTLVLMLALAAPVGEAIYSALGSNLLGARNLNASWPGLALAIGGLVTLPGGALSVVATALALAGFGVGAVKSLSTRWSRPAFETVAEYIDAHAKPGDVIVDGSALTPVPLTGLDVYLHSGLPEIRLGLPVTDRPILPLDPVPAVPDQTRQAIREAGRHRIFLVGATTPDLLSPARASFEGDAGELLRLLPRDYRERRIESFQGLMPLSIVVAQKRGHD
jgi:mannosyltransferase